MPNLNNADVKKAAVENMFPSVSKLFGKTPSIQQIESRVPESSAAEASDGENYDKYIDDTYNEGRLHTSPGFENMERKDDDRIRPEDFYCDKCGMPISQKVWNYSVEKFECPLCYKCQKLVRDDAAW